MAFSPDSRAYPNQSATTTAVLDAGLRAYMLRVYNWMSSGLLLTGIVAYAIAHTGAIDAFFPLVQTVSGRMVRAPTALAYIAMLAPLGFVLVLSFGVNRLSTSSVQALFWAFCAAMGASLTSIFVVYTGASIAEVFFITAATFAANVHIANGGGGATLVTFTGNTNSIRLLNVGVASIDQTDFKLA